MLRLLTLILLSALAAGAQTPDTAVVEEDCYVRFFRQAKPVTSPDRTMLTFKGGKTAALTEHLQGEGGSESFSGLFDFDHDGRPELLTWSFTGGAHCCDQVYLFRNTGAERYTQVAFFSGGNTCMDADGFTFRFDEWLGYFYTCYACELEWDAPKGLQPVRSIQLTYQAGKISVVPGNAALLRILRSNLAVLGKLKWDGGINEKVGDQDDGRRKEVAMNLAVHYFSFGRNLAETKKLFLSFYRFPDAAQVWAKFTPYLASIRKANDF